MKRWVAAAAVLLGLVGALAARRSSGPLISLAHASDVMVNFTRYSGTVTPSSADRQPSNGRSWRLSGPMATITCRAKQGPGHSRGRGRLRYRLRQAVPDGGAAR